MLVIITTDHVSVLRPVHKSDGGTVHSDESLAIVVDERNKIGLLPSIHLEVATGKEKYGIEIVQILGVVFQLLLGQRFGVGAQGGVPESSLLAQTLKS